jgi:hypothetical protein
MDKAHDLKNVSFDGDTMLLSVDGTDYKVEISGHSTKLSKATLQQKQYFAISPSGYGIRWPELDEDLSIDSLIGVRHSSPFTKSAI